MQTIYTVVIYNIFGGIDDLHTFTSKSEAEQFVVIWGNKNSEEKFMDADGVIDWFVDNDDSVELSIRLFETEVKTDTLEIKADTLSQDIIDILEGVIELTPVDAPDFMWMVRMETLAKTLNDESEKEDYDDAYSKEWSIFVKECQSSGAKYVIVLGN